MVDIYLSSPTTHGSGRIRSKHAALTIIEETGAVLLWHHSDLGTVEPLSQDTGVSYTVKFPHGAKSVLVARCINTRIASGKDKHYMFEVRWYSDGLYDFLYKDQHYDMGPTHPRHRRYTQGGNIDRGMFGSVYRALDATTGRWIAVKKYHSLSGRNHVFATREVTHLSRIKHVS